MSLLLGTRELADLHPRTTLVSPVRRWANVTTLVAHRQVVPDSAEAIAAVAGTGSRGRGREFVIHPTQQR